VAASTQITVAHLMTHTSGLTYDFQRTHPVDEIYRAKGYDFASRKDIDLAGAVDDWCTSPLVFEPGSRFNYSVATDVLGRLEEARATKDVVKLNCVNEKLTQVKGLLRISEQSDVALQEAVSKRDSTAAEHEYSKISIARNKVGQLRTEAEQCIGQLAFRTDENLTVEVEVPNGLPEDPTNPPPLAPVTSRLPPASPIL